MTLLHWQRVGFKKIADFEKEAKKDPVEFAWFLMDIIQYAYEQSDDETKEYIKERVGKYL